jgi:hypothetical protein
MTRSPLLAEIGERKGDSDTVLRPKANHGNGTSFREPRYDLARRGRAPSRLFSFTLCSPLTRVLPGIFGDIFGHIIREGDRGAHAKAESRDWTISLWLFSYILYSISNCYFQ